MRILDYYTLIRSHRSWVRFCRREALWPSNHDAPKKYPCLADVRTGSDENPYLVYLTAADVEKMRRALTGKSRGGVKATSN